MSTRMNLTGLPVFVILLSLIISTDAVAQSICDTPSFLGTTGPEICISITELSQDGAVVSGPVNIRGPAVGPGPAMIAIPLQIVGQYSVVMNIAYISTPTGMAIGMDGVVTRTSAGSNQLSIVAQGGWGTVLSAASGSLNLVGLSTGTSRVIVGGAAGYPQGRTPAEDIRFVGFSRMITEVTYNGGPFADTILGQSVDAGAVAIHVQTVFHLNNVGDTTDIPSGVGLAPIGGKPPTLDMTANKAKPHFECYSVDVHDPKQKKYRYVELNDQFARVKKKIGKITRICTPVDKNNEGIPDKNLHLVCYEILKGHKPEKLVQTNNQFGKATMKVRKAKELCVPSTKELINDKKKKKE